MWTASAWSLFRIQRNFRTFHNSFKYVFQHSNSNTHNWANFWPRTLLLISFNRLFYLVSGSGLDSIATEWDLFLFMDTNVKNCNSDPQNSRVLGRKSFSQKLCFSTEASQIPRKGVTCLVFLEYFFNLSPQNILKPVPMCQKNHNSTVFQPTQTYFGNDFWLLLLLLDTKLEWFSPK